MKLELHHVSILTSDIDGTIAFYQEMLGMQLSRRFYKESTFNIAFLRDRSVSSPFALEIIGPPFSGWMEDLYSESGPMLGHFSFLVDDVDGWFDKLKVQGVEFVQPPPQFLNVNETYFRDPSRIIIQMIHFPDPAMVFAIPEKAPSNSRIKYRLHHMSITCQNYSSMEHFYVEELGLKTVLDLRKEGVAFLADPVVVADKLRDGPAIEIIAPPGLWEREQAFLDKYGPGIDHISFLVDDFEAAYEELKSKGAQFHVEPVDFEGARLAFFRDPNGVDIEIELPNLVERFSI